MKSGKRYLPQTFQRHKVCNLHKVKKYEAKRHPMCNGGFGCELCWDKYLKMQKKRIA